MSNDELKDILIGLTEDWTLAAIISESRNDSSAAAAYDNCASDLLKVVRKLQEVL